MLRWTNLIIGGAAGTTARYLLAGFVYQAFGAQFPYGTLIVNLTGCFLIGFLDILSTEKFLLGPQARLLLMIGFCGAFTTFSTFILETANLIKDGESLKAFMNVVISVTAGFAALKLGIFAGEII